MRGAGRLKETVHEDREDGRALKAEEERMMPTRLGAVGGQPRNLQAVRAALMPAQATAKGWSRSPPAWGASERCVQGADGVGDSAPRGHTPRMPLEHEDDGR